VPQNGVWVYTKVDDIGCRYKIAWQQTVSKVKDIHVTKYQKNALSIDYHYAGKLEAMKVAFRANLHHCWP
jgi:hypothetical protein